MNGTMTIKGHEYEICSIQINSGTETGADTTETRRTMSDRCQLLNDGQVSAEFEVNMWHGHTWGEYAQSVMNHWWFMRQIIG